MSPRIRFEPLGEEIDSGAEETVLDAAFRHGYNLVYGCREGQCSACKCFLLEGEAELKPYSTFALSDTERSNGYTLMCRAMPEQDLVVELLHYDRDNYRLENPIREGRAVVRAIEELGDDITRLRLDAPGFEFVPGQYVDLHVGDARRSFSMANAEAGEIELIIRRYAGGRFSGKLEGELKVGDSVTFTGPYGALRVREGERPILMIAGGSGIAPILSLLRALDSAGCERPIHLFFAARTMLCDEEIGRLGLPDFHLHHFPDRRALGAIDAFLLDGEHLQPDVYMCGPPPLLEAAEELLVGKHKLDEQRIFMDKFTASADAAPRAPRHEASERDFTWFTPRGRRATLYEDVTVDTQPSVHRHLTRGWPVSFEDGRGTWSDSSTALRSSDWFEFRDPGEQWERPYYQTGTALEQQIEGALRSASDQGLLSDFSPEWVEFLRSFLQVPAYVEHGLWFATATAARDCLSDSVCTCVCLQAAMKQRSAQAIVLYAMDLERHFGDFSIEAAQQSFLLEAPWQPTRRYLERLAHTRDWGEVIIAANLCFEPLVGTLLRRELGTRAAAANGDIVTPALARVATQEWEWTRAWTAALCGFLAEDPEHATANRETIGRWAADWLPEALGAALALAPLGEALPGGVDSERTAERIRRYAAETLQAARLPELCEVVDLPPRATEVVPPPPRRQERARKTRTGPPKPPRASGPVSRDGATYDYVGIVMAKSAEGDAVAEILRSRDDIEVIEQPAFWDIRAKDRLVIPYDDVREALGYDVDAYSIQHEMSTHYGRMVATDEALMLFSDPLEAMGHLMS